MAESFFEPGENRAEKVSELVSKIAPRYYLINDLQSFGLHRYWKSRVIRIAAPKAGIRALDVCCGTGDLSFALAKKSADVVGLDFNQPMLDVASLRSTKAAEYRGAGAISASNPRFLRGDAQSLPFEDASFDLVTVGYGLRNLVSWELGLDEMHRVIKPGGRIVVLDFGKPENGTWRTVYFSYLRLFVPWLGRIFFRNPAAYSYILESLEHYPAQLGVAMRMREIGLVQVQVLNPLWGVMGINYGEKKAIPVSKRQ